MISSMKAFIGGEEVVKREGYFFEPKLDGYRAFCFFKDGKFKLYSRRGLDLTKEYPEIKLRVNAKECILDGEIVAFNERGIPDFNLLQNHEKEVKFIVFDLLSKDGHDLKKEPLFERKKILEKTLIDNRSTQKIVFTEDGKKLLKLVKKMKFEGIIAKEKSSEYLSSRSRKWLKIKFTKAIDCVILGYQSGKRKISSLLLGVYQNNNLRFIGKVGTGFNDRVLADLGEKFSEIETEQYNVRHFTERSGKFVKPELVCEVRFQEVTPDVRLRAPVFLRLRDDKPPTDCRGEEIGL